MKEQEFRITVRMKAKVASGDVGREKPYLTETRVRRQIEKFLKRSICEGLPCHGEATIEVTEVIEYSQPS